MCQAHLQGRNLSIARLLPPQVRQRQPRPSCLDKLPRRCTRRRRSCAAAWRAVAAARVAAVAVGASAWQLIICAVHLVILIPAGQSITKGWGCMGRQRCSTLLVCRVQAAAAPHPPYLAQQPDLIPT